MAVTADLREDLAETAETDETGGLAIADLTAGMITSSGNNNRSRKLTAIPQKQNVWTRTGRRNMWTGRYEAD